MSEQPPPDPFGAPNPYPPNPYPLNQYPPFPHPQHPPQYTPDLWQRLTPRQQRDAWKAAYPPKPSRFNAVGVLLGFGVFVVVIVAVAPSLRERPGIAIAAGGVLLVAGVVAASLRGPSMVRGAGLGAVIGVSFVVVMGGALLVVGAVATVLYTACIGAFAGNQGGPAPAVTSSPFPTPPSSISTTGVP